MVASIVANVPTRVRKVARGCAKRHFLTTLATILSSNVFTIQRLVIKHFSISLCKFTYRLGYSPQMAPHDHALPVLGRLASFKKEERQMRLNRGKMVLFGVVFMGLGVYGVVVGPQRWGSLILFLLGAAIAGVMIWQIKSAK
jgi:hypothetical protein